MVILDDEVSEDFAAKVHAYVAAFFHGVPVRLYRKGDKIKEKAERGNKVITKAVIPVDFMTQHEIPEREYQGHPQYNAEKCCQALKDYNSRESFSTIAVTNEQDLYICDDEKVLEKMPFCFGLADTSSHSSMISLKRHFEGEQEYEEPGVGLKWTCQTLVHELCHLFGLMHCTYYECVMNGCQNNAEKYRRQHRILCPVCLCKLQLNIKFDVRERYARLHQVSFDLGLHEQAQTIA